MDPLTFNQQLALMLIDKLAIGLVIVLVAFFGQRLLEVYKGRQVLWTEISKERVKHIASEWNEMNKWDAIVGSLYVKLQHILERQMGQKAGVRISTTNQPELSETIAFLSQLDLSAISAGLTEQCRQELDPLIAESTEQSAKVSLAMQENRFWLGRELYEHCRKFQAALHNICVSFGSMDFTKLVPQAEVLKAAREDVLTTLARLR